MAGESGQVTTVAANQEGDRVLVSVPMVGFPPGFKLRAGERVVLVQHEAGPAVMPLVREVRVDSIEEAAGALSAAGRHLAIQESTVRGDQGSRGPYVVTTVDGGSAGGPEQVIAIRPAE